MPMYTVSGVEGHYVLLKDGNPVFDHHDQDFLADWAVDLNEAAAKRRSSQWDTGTVIVDSPMGAS